MIIKKSIGILLELTKFRITSFVTLTTFLGYILFKQRIEIDLIGLLLGVLLLSGGAAIFNHFQERKFDILMERTKSRPIPSARVQASTAFILGFVYSLGGLLILYYGFGIISAILGLIALFWYNLLYTPLKRKFALAIIPGSLVGSIPPMIGWVAAGGYVFDPAILMIAFFFFIWQIPHFWLLMLFFDEDYKKAGFPTLTQYFDKEQILRITFVWMIALAIATLIMPIFQLTKSDLVNYGLIITAIWFIYYSIKMLISFESESILIKGFRRINSFAIIITLELCVDKFL